MLSAMDKPSLRRHYLSLRETLSGEARAAAEQEICVQALKLCDEYDAAAGYIAMRGEVSLDALAQSLCEKQIAYAIPRAEQLLLSFRRWSPGDALERGAHGQPEPSDAAARVHPRMIFVPLLAFDRHGHRLGYGGGYYDRTLEALRKAGAVDLAVGIGFGLQEAKRLPAEAHDQLLDAVITEREIIRF